MRNGAPPSPGRSWLRRNALLLIIASAVALDLIYIGLSHYVRQADVIHLLQFPK